MTGVNGGRDVNVRDYAANGMSLVGRLIGADGRTLSFSDDLERLLNEADDSAGQLTRAIDEYINRQGLSADLDVPAGSPSSTTPVLEIDELDLDSSGIKSVIWCSGYQYDFGWAKIPVLSATGAPVQTRGLTDCSGAYFLSLHWMHKFKSGLLFGVGEDAAFIADEIEKSS